AEPNEVVVADSTSLNLYKILSAAIGVVNASQPGSPRPIAQTAAEAARGRPAIVSERTNFPTDLYIADSLARAHGFDLVLVDADQIPACLAEAGQTQSGESGAILMLTHVNYRTGHMHRMAEVTRAAHAAGAIMIWDLAHSAGAMPVQLHGDGSIDEAADFAVGCGYKYLNGGPGAPAVAWGPPPHLAW